MMQVFFQKKYYDASILPKEILVDLMGYVSMKVSSTLKMFDMHVDMGFFKLK
jgi:hypothetical protein